MTVKNTCAVLQCSI